MTQDREAFDRTLDALLRAHSTETPAPEIDAAILAAAHRAVQTGPRGAVRPAEATSPWRWWMPLAAAATIGAIAISVLQLLPKEPESTATIVSDTQSAARSAPQRTGPDTPAPPPAPSIAQKPVVPPRSAAQANPAPATGAKNEATAPEPLPARERDAAAQGATPPNNAAGALAAPETPRAAASAVAKQRAALAAADASSVDEWIARIRALLNENRIDDAARELNAFRAAHADADARLPPELKEWAATVKR